MRSPVCVLTSASGQAPLTADIEAASCVVYLMTAGIMDLLAISYMVLASILMALEKFSYSTSALDSSSALVNTPNSSNSFTALSVVRAGMASTMERMLGRPLFPASATHSSEYPFPLKMTLLWADSISLIMSWTAMSKSSAFSRASAASLNASATMVFNTVLGLAMESEEPTIRNSNLLPVNANGEVLFLSVASLSRSGRISTPVLKVPPFLEWVASPVLHSWSITSSSCSPRKMEIMAGGASLAPSLWSLPTSAADSRSRSA